MASAAEQEFLKLLADAQAISIRFTKYYAAGIAGLIALATLANWTKIAFDKYGSRSSALSHACAAVSRPVRRFLKGSPSAGFIVLPGRILLAMTFAAINLAFAFTDINWSIEVVFAKRLGWLTLCNICLTVFLGLKNTPLSPLAGKSYDSVNVLHRFVGYTTILLMLLHLSIHIAGLFKAHALDLMMETGQHLAVVAAASLVVIGITASRFVRKGQYELFYVVHVTLVVLVLAAVLVHVNQANIAAVIVVIVAACMWFADRSLRLSRWIYNGYGNYCTLTPLSGGATRVTMNRPIRGAAGSHAFLWIPKLRAFQTHPFTLVSNKPVAEFIVQAQNGFTRDLHELACRDPKVQLRAAIEGPYGQTPSVDSHNKTVLIGGGSGATFTMALAMEWLRNHKDADNKDTLDFTWSVKHMGYLSWFDVELSELESSPRVTLHINVTQQQESRTSTDDAGPSPISPSSDVDDKEKVLCAAASRASSLALGPLSRLIQRGRPDVDALVRLAVRTTPRDSRVLVAASGPTALLNDARAAVTACMTAQAPGIDMHLEEFDW